MSTTAITRRLAAIVMADVVGYSRLMERDEAGTLARLRELRQGLIDPKLAEYRGRIIKTAGDGMLFEFTSAMAALRFSVDVQRELGHRNLYVAPDARLELRIGINLGDILDDGTEIAGDGINVAARLEALAEPGGICIASNVREQVHEDLCCGFEDIGDQQVKNIARPVHAFRVRLAAGPAPERPPEQRTRVSRKLRVAGAAATLVVLAAALVAGRGFYSRSETPPAVQSTPAQPPALSLAILPFTMVGADAAGETLAEDLTRDLITSLGRTARYALVSSYGNVAPYQSKPADPRAIGRDLNVRYVLEGDIRRSGDRLTIDTRLIDTRDGRQVSAGRSDDESAAPGQQGAIVAPLAGRTRDALLQAEIRRAVQEPGKGPVELWLRALALEEGSLQGAREAEKQIDEALQLDPRFVSALIEKAWLANDQLLLDPNADRDRQVREFDEYSNRAVTADPSDPRTWQVRIEALILQWRWAEALEANTQFLRLDPSRTYAYYLARAAIMIFTGRPDDAVAELDKAGALDPRGAGDGVPLRWRCRAWLAQGRYGEAIRACERSVVLDANWATYLYLAAAYAQTGDMPKATMAKAQLLKLLPGYTIARFRTLRISDDPAYWQQVERYLFPGLRKAGLPEH